MSIASETRGQTIDRVDSRLHIRDHEKSQFGEVLTPSTLIIEVCDHLPKRVWSDPKLRWLDPAAGTGNFMSIVFHRLDHGLRKWQPSAAKRRQHILTKMLFQVELNSSHIPVLHELFGKNSHITQGDFLQEEWRARLGVGTFDVVVGNPPYQRGMAKRTGTNAGRRTLWDQFVVKGLAALNPGGFMGYITPAGWRGTGRHSHIGKLLKTKRILYLRVYSQADGQRLFGVTTRFDVYVVQNTPATASHRTEVVDEHSNGHSLELSKWPFIPAGMFTEFAGLLFTGPHTDRRKVIYKYDLSTLATARVKPTLHGKFTQRVVHSINGKGVGYWYASDAMKGQGGLGAPKVVLNFNSKQYSYPAQNDYRGKLAMSQLSFGIPIASKADGEKVLKAIDTPLFRDLIAASKWGAFQTDYRMFNHFRDDWPDWVLKHSKPLGRATRRAYPASRRRTRRAR